MAYQAPMRPITRVRDRLACTECRRRKLKCDRITPCSSCVRRGNPSACGYQRESGSLEDERERRVQAEQRLEHLEKLVHQLATQQAQTRTQTQIQTSYQSAPNDDLVYNGSTHWSAMLQDIQALRSTITPADETESEPPEPDTPTEDSGIHLLFGIVPSDHLTFAQILARYLPSRQETDRLTAAYFRHKAVAAPFIHLAQFRRLYQAFWTSPTSAPPLWTSLLFSICHIAFSAHQRLSSNSSPSSHFSLASAHCLTLGFYFRPQPFAVEALLLFTQAQYITSIELPPDLGPLFGSLIRLATQMGYHRDPDLHRPHKFTPFEAEMRRRTWSLAMQLDLLVSFHLGLPTNVQFPMWDTRPPRAVTDAELREDMSELPPERMELTDILFYVVKHRCIEVFGKILRHALAIQHQIHEINGQKLPQKEEVDTLDAEIRSVYAAIPEELQSKNISDSVFDSPTIIVSRFCVSNLYNKCLCVLHRQYVVLGRAESISVCWESSKAILNDMIDLSGEFEPGGQMETEAWFMSSLTWHDFLIGATALCLVLCTLKRSGQISVEDIELLKRARSVFAKQVSKKTRDAGRVVAVIDATVLHVASNGVILNNNASVAAPDLDTPSHDRENSNQMTASENSWASEGFNITNEPLDDPTWDYLEQFLDLEAR